MIGLTPDIDKAVREWREHGVAGDTKMDVHKALAKLPAPNRRLVVLRVFEGHTWAECAEEMNKGASHKMTPDGARRMFRETAVAMKKILTRSPKLVPLIKPRGGAGRP